MSLIASHEALEQEKAQSDDAKRGQIEVWAEETYMHKLQKVDIVSREDGLHLADLAIKQLDRKPLCEYISTSLKIPEHCALILSRYLHITRPLTNFTAFSVAFVTRLMTGIGEERAELLDDAFAVFLVCWPSSKNLS